VGRTGRWTASAIAVVGTLVLSACSGSGYHYVKNSEDKTYFKVPEGWRLYDEDEVIKELNKDLSPSQREQQAEDGWQVVFDASPKPTLKHLGDVKAKNPIGLAFVDELSFDDSDQISIGALRNQFFDIDTGLDNGTGEVITYEPLALDGGFHGIHLVATMVTDGGSVTFNQTSVVDQTTSKLFTLFISCSVTCYERHEDKIDRIVDSWTVKD
jgi:hypothetical protein